MKQHPQIAALGAQIRSRRQELGLTQSRLAALTDLSRASINTFEAGTTDLGVVKVLKIAQVLDMSLFMKKSKQVAPAKRWLKAALASGSVSYRTPLPESELVRAVKTGEVAPEFLPHIATLLEEASPTLLVRALHDVFPQGVPKAAWNNLSRLGRQTKVARQHLRP
jgi:transcriptional regulator with XRE-family HTH domain